MSSEYLTEEEHERLQKVLAALEKKNKPLPLWRLFREALLSGGACRDIVEKHVMCKLNGTDLKFFIYSSFLRYSVRLSLSLSQTSLP